MIIFGERKYAMRIWLDPTKLAARQLTAADVVSALQEQNVEIACRTTWPATRGPEAEFPNHSARRGTTFGSRKSSKTSSSGTRRTESFN